MYMQALMMKLKMSHRRIQSTPIAGGFGTSHIVNKGHALLPSKVEGASGEARFQWFTVVSKLQKRQIKMQAEVLVAGGGLRSLDLSIRPRESCELCL